MNNKIINLYVKDMLKKGTYTDYAFDYKPTFKELKNDAMNDTDFINSGLYNRYKNLIEKELNK